MILVHTIVDHGDRVYAYEVLPSRSPATDPLALAGLNLFRAEILLPDMRNDILSPRR